ncbi:MAG: hypothetical protein JJ892_02685 [Balneola sp.]|nr:hypothetical protein [Balneola sp.]MBO6710473.1 hypothetical protein [Balneola sp.]MBO6799158.1 hypothetical protein [Balneola sp.]MBO6870998.1 hypothetical protein [Balneola sp.]
MSNTLKNKTLYVFHENSGSQGVLTLSDSTKGTYKVGPSNSNVTWSEFWVGNKCALWVVINNQIEDNIIRIWGFELNMNGDLIMGTGMSAFGNATPQDLSNTTYISDDLTIGSSPRS